jgi:hypothetical protein
LLGIAYMPVLQRPRGSLAAGLAIAVLTAAALAVLMGVRPTIR